MYKSIVTTMTLVLTLAACGGSGGGGAMTDDAPDNPDLTFAQTEAEFTDLVERFADDIQNDNWTSPDDLTTTSGTAEYVGVIGVGVGQRDLNGELIFVEDDIFAVSEMNLEVDLSESTISGTADNFFEADEDQALVGSLSLEGDILSNVDVDVEFGIEGRITGELEDSDGLNATLDLDLLADFYDDGAFILGQADGTATVSAGDVNGAVGAVFIAEGQ